MEFDNEYEYNYGNDSKNNYIKQMNNIYKICKSSVKIILPNNNVSSGFFMKLLRNKKNFYCLITNEHAITPEMIQNNDIIIVLYENESNNLIINLDKTERIIECFEESLNIDITVVEIIPKDRMDASYFLDKYDSQNENLNLDEYIGREMQLIQYPQGKALSFSEGIILGNYSDNIYLFTHTANTKYGSSGSPIFLKGDDKVFAIHKGKLAETKENVGILLEIIYDIFKDYKKEGYFIEYYENGEVKYKGNFSDDEYNDINGKFIYENGEYYIGGFKNGIREGKGIEYYINDEKKYDGEFSNNKYNGDGKLFYENGEFYKGKFKDGKREGKGTEYYTNEKVKYDGVFLNDQYYDKNGIFFEENGYFYNGEFKNGKKNGHCVYYTNEKKLIQDGLYKDDKFIFGKDYSTSLNKFKGAFVSLKSNIVKTFSPIANFFGRKCKKCEHLLENHDQFISGWLKCRICPEEKNLCQSN